MRWNRLTGMASRLARPSWAWVPGVANMRGYTKARLRTDLVAGLTVGAVAVPGGLAMGKLAGVSPVAGLYATMLPLVAYALFGSSRQLVVGPDGVLAILTATTVAPLATGEPLRYAALAAALALMMGVVHLVSSALRLGFMADFLSLPILLGYFNGLALIIIASQIGPLFGVSVSAHDFFPIVGEFVAELGEANTLTIVVSAVLLALVLVLKRIKPMFPGSLLAVVVAAVASVVFDLSDRGVAVVGDVEAGLPVLGIPNVSLHDLSTLAIPAAGMALVAFGDTIATGRIYATRNGYTVNANQELLALGTANIAAGFSQAIAVSSSGSRTALNDASRGMSQVVGLVSAVLAFAVATVGTPLIEPLPIDALSVVVVAAALGMFDLRGMLRLRRVRTAELGLALATLVGVLALGVLGGLLVAIVLSIGVFVYRSVRPHDAVLGEVADMDGYQDIEAFPAAETVPGLVVYRFDAALYFPNCPYFLDRARQAVAAADPPARWVMLNAEAITYVDSTAVQTLRELRSELAESGITLTVARAKIMVRNVFDTTGFTGEIGRANFFTTVSAGVRAYEERTGNGRH
jgi:SulP family sulfate permease